MKKNTKKFTIPVLALACSHLHRHLPAHLLPGRKSASPLLKQPLPQLSHMISKELLHFNWFGGKERVSPNLPKMETQEKFSPLTLHILIIYNPEDFFLFFCWKRLRVWDGLVGRGYCWSSGLGLHNHFKHFLNNYQRS